MTIIHSKVYLKQDTNLDDVRLILGDYPRARLDEDNYVVYYNDAPDDVNELIEELFPFKYSAELTTETF